MYKQVVGQQNFNMGAVVGNDNSHDCERYIAKHSKTKGADGFFLIDGTLDNNDKKGNVRHRAFKSIVMFIVIKCANFSFVNVSSQISLRISASCSIL